MSQSFFEIGKEASKNFLSNLKKDKHLLLLYEDAEKAINFQIDFILQGLEKKECCIIAMPSNIDFEEKLAQKIDIQRFKNDELLHILKVPSTIDYSKSFETFKKFASDILSISSDKVRICGMLDFDLSKKEGMDAFISAETISHKNFHSFNGSWLCSYDVKKMEEKEKMSWIKKLFNCHDSVIVIPEQNGGIAFDVE